MRFKTEIEVVSAADYDFLSQKAQETQNKLLKQIEETESELSLCQQALEVARADRDKACKERDKLIELCRQLKTENEELRGRADDPVRPSL